ncbi:bacterial transferase hexapeptide repeat protein [Mobiluncus mulieris 28-1]|uniref:DapH/DapD/GlmU-related protein n=1 Tax=Mobiluncus mulieris TaxID=2052 RepID=UPI0001BE7B41|nr:bacterial transferase hexapeptide repeat protein [Mobiluncus mulieris 28-1]
MLPPLKATSRREGGEGGTPITIGNKVRLGANVLVLPGVTIGDNTVVGTGSVVTRNLPANVIAVGNPAQVYRDLPTDT